MKKLSVGLGLLMMFCWLVSCSQHQEYIRGGDIHAKARKVAVLPLVNLTMHPNAGRIVGDLLTTQLYLVPGFHIMERTRMLKQLRGGEKDLDQILETSVALDVGKQLNVDTVIFGSVTEYRYKRGLDEDPVVGINLRLLDVNSGKVLWAASRSETGGCFWLCEDSLSRLAQKTCSEMVQSMLEANE